MAKCIVQILKKNKLGNILSHSKVLRVSNERAIELVKQQNYHYVPKSVWKRTREE